MSHKLDALIDQIGKLGFKVWEFMPNRPDEVERVACIREYPAHQVADVVLFFDEGLACAYRVPLEPGIDPLDPHRVWWWYGTNPADTMDNMIRLPAPDDPHAPGPGDSALNPAGFGIPAEVRRRGTKRLRFRAPRVTA